MKKASLFLIIVLLSTTGFPAWAEDARSDKNAAAATSTAPATLISLEAGHKSGRDRQQSGGTLVSWEKIPFYAPMPTPIPVLSPAEPFFSGGARRQFEVEEAPLPEKSLEASR